MTTPTLRARMDAARQALPSVTEKYAALPIADQNFLGSLPEKVTTLAEVVAVEKIAARLQAVPAKPAAQAPAPAVTKPSLGAQVLAAVTDPKTSAPAIAGLNQSLAARLGLKEERFISLAEFRTLTHGQRSEYIRNGGRLRDPEPEPVTPLAPGAKTATRAQFHTLPHAERGAFFKNGGKLID